MMVNIEFGVEFNVEINDRFKIEFKSYAITGMCVCGRRVMST